MSRMQIGALDLLVQRKAIKNLHISVLPPDGRVRVSAPERMTETAIRMAVISRIPWIKTQQRDFARQPRQPQREMIAGETHYLWGRRFRLSVVIRDGKPEALQKGNARIALMIAADAPLEKRLAVLNDFYRATLKSRIRELLLVWQPIVGVCANDWGVKKMKTKWGSCSVEAKRIWLNLELAKKPPQCLEYILVHELVHLLERNHNDRFRNLMDQLLPDWRERRNLLNSMPLAFENWIY